MIFGNGLKKIRKKDAVKVATLMTPPELVGAIFAYGRIRSGKTTSLLALAGMYHDNPNRNYKIIDLWGGDRNEHLYWTLPSNKKKYWEHVKKTLRLDTPGPKQYKVKLIYPLTNKLRDQLPFKPDCVSSEFFTIPIRDLTMDDFALVVGSIPDNSVGYWKNVISESKKSHSAAEIVYRFKKEVPKNNMIYNTILKPLTNELLLQDDNCVYNLDQKMISKDLDDRETITVLCLDFVDKEYRLFVIGYYLRKICDELDRKRRKVIGIMREASEFFKVNDQSVVPERYKAMKNYLSQWIRMGRRGLHLLLDTQSPAETRGMVDGQQDLTLLGRLPSEADRRLATEQLFKDGLIDKRQITLLANVDPGQFVFCPSGKHAYFAYLFMPRCRFWEEANGSFYNNVWAKEVNRWTEYQVEIAKLREKYQADQEEIKNRESENPKVKKKGLKVEEESEEEEEIVIKKEKTQEELWEESILG